MTNNYRLYTWNSFIYYLTKNDTFELFKRLLWLTGLGINILCLLTYELPSFTLTATNANTMDDRRLDAGDYQYGITVVSAVFAGICMFIFLIWLGSRYILEVSSKREVFKIKYPFKDAYNIPNTLRILFYDSFLAQGAPLNFFLHFVFAILGIFLNPFFHSLHLLLIVNISQTAKYVVQAVFVHID